MKILALIILTLSEFHLMNCSDWFFKNKPKGNLLSLGFARKLVKPIHHKERPLPVNFDLRKEWPQCESLRQILNQGDCHTCWALSVSSMLTDRYCIKHKGKRKFQFSPQDIINCCDECLVVETGSRCNSLGHIDTAVVYSIEQGVVSMDCKPYSVKETRDQVKPSCKTFCTNVKHNVSYKAEKHFGTGITLSSNPRNLDPIRIEIMINGPVISIFNVFHDFFHKYSDEILHQPLDESEETFPHAVKIIGWGEENGLPYWLIANTWGPDWGNLVSFGRISLRIQFVRAMAKPISHRHQEVPENFDSREKWPECQSIRRIIDEESCDASWAISAAMTLSDRLCISTNGKDQFEFSIQDIMTCCNYCWHLQNTSACKAGGFAEGAFYFLSDEGGVSGGDKGCKPYAADSYIASQCYDVCTNTDYSASYERDKRFSDELLKTNHPRALNAIQVEIMLNGPLVALMRATADFRNNYKTGVYSGSEVEENGTDHCVKIIGWGVEKDLPYWLVANSWGTKWGEMGGFFKIVRGSNRLGIEELFITGTFKYNSFTGRNALEVTNYVVFILCCCFIILN